MRKFARYSLVLAMTTSAALAGGRLEASDATWSAYQQAAVSAARSKAFP